MSFISNLLVAALSVAVLLLVAYSADALAQYFSNNPLADKEGSWYVGEGIGQGDYFHYTICHIDYNECRDFEFEFWIKGDVAVGTETHLLAEVRVRDGYKVIVGNMTLGEITREPTGSSPELDEYRRAFGSSVTWLSEYASANIPKAFSNLDWGIIASSVDKPKGVSDYPDSFRKYRDYERIRPTAIENVTVTAGTWEAVRVEWRLESPLYEYREHKEYWPEPRIFKITTGGPVIKAWVVDEFPFPIKATAPHYTSKVTPRIGITEGTPPEYEFVLRDYEQGVQENPFEGIVSTDYSGGGCLVATAAYGSELAPQVQLLREIRDGTILSTASGASFMAGFNQAYYLFSPAIADAERENPIFREAVKAFITPMLFTLSIMTLVDEGSEAAVLGLGISVIALNLGMYVVAPVLAGFKICRRIVRNDSGPLIDAMLTRFDPD